jgi:hypothetical protein
MKQENQEFLLFLLEEQKNKEIKNKNILLSDLCARLPYGVKVKFKVNEVIANKEKIIYNVDGEDSYITDGKSYLTWDFIKALTNNYLDEIKPYLFPLTSMTEEQKEELFYNYIHNDIYFDDFTDYFLAGELWHDITVSIDVFPGLIDWFNLNHFDYRGLIEKGLAIDATGKNIY